MFCKVDDDDDDEVVVSSLVGDDGDDGSVVESVDFGAVVPWVNVNTDEVVVVAPVPTLPVVCAVVPALLSILHWIELPLAHTGRVGQAILVLKKKLFMENWKLFKNYVLFQKNKLVRIHLHIDFDQCYKPIVKKN